MTAKPKRDPAGLLAEIIVQKICVHLRSTMEVWPKESDIADMKRITKALIIDNMEMRFK